MLNRLKVLVLLGFQVTSSLHLSGMQIESIDYAQAKQDVLPFIKNPRALDVWNSDFFIAITEDLK